MKAYEPPEIKPFSKVPAEPGLDTEAHTTLVSLLLQDYQKPSRDQELWANLEEHEEEEYFIRASQRVMQPAGS